jgi:hypothetical protein
MTPDEKKHLNETVKKAMKMSSQMLIEKKRALGQSVVISENGVIKRIKL